MGDRWAVLATGPSLTPEQVESVRHLPCIAVSDAYKLAPWARALVSADAAWWRFHKPEFAGLRYSAATVDGCQKVEATPAGFNSGALAIRVARTLGAKEIIVLGLDGHGTHFFGRHPLGLNNATERSRAIHSEQHRIEAFQAARAGVKVWNCTPGTVIKWYPQKSLDECLQPAADATPARTNTNSLHSLTC